MKYLMSVIKVVLIRAVSIALTFIFGLFLYSLTKIPVEKPQSYVLPAEIYYQTKITKDCYTKPNPLLILVRADEKRNIRLNMEDIGTLNDTTDLEKRLVEVFRFRIENDVRRSDTNQIEKTVFIDVDKSTSYGDLVRLIEVLNKAGANPIYLDPDNKRCGRSYGSGGRTIVDL